MGRTRDDYTLTVRQQPERAKAFAGPKEKGDTLRRILPLQKHLLIILVSSTDRKPVDPPPIIQLQIRDPQDPAQYVT